MPETDRQFVITIESAVSGGSISLLKGDDEVDFIVGSGTISRAEDLLFEIALLLERNGVSKSSIAGLVVSVGPGSYTGIRIAIATALGLKNGLMVPCFGVSILAALAASRPGEEITAAVHLGKSDVAYQHFEQGGDPGPMLVTSAAEFYGEVRLSGHPCIVDRSTHELLIALTGDAEQRFELTDAGPCLATYLGAALKQEIVTTEIEPIFAVSGSSK